MARIKSAKSHNQKAESSFLSNVFIGGVLGFLIYNVVNHFSNGDNDYKFIGFIIGFSVACFFLIRGLSLYSENNEDDKFHCPDCSKHIPTPLKNSGEDGEPILYECEACDVLWHIGNTST